MNGNATWLEKDFYKVLGVPQNSAGDEIKRAYRRLARTHHPDRNPGDAAAEARMKEISEAYAVLSDPKKRSEYDEMRRLARSGFRSGGFRRGSVPVEDLPFDLSEMFGGLFGGARGAASRGADLETEVRLSFDDALAGVTVPVLLPRDVVCETCGGSGAAPGSSAKRCEECHGTGVVGEDQGLFSFQRPCGRCGGSGRVVESPCPACRGEGAVRRREEIKVRIPAGVQNGARIRARGRGSSGSRGGAAGDLYVVVRVGEHPIFGRRGADLTLELPVTFAEAALGAEIKVPTLGEPVTLRIPAGTQTGRTFRVRGRGAPKAKGGTGDLLVTARLVVPEKLSSKERELVRKLAETQTGSPREHLGI
jgi:molecular chaperone DnaJ